MSVFVHHVYNMKGTLIRCGLCVQCSKHTYTTHKHNPHVDHRPSNSCAPPPHPPQHRRSCQRSHAAHQNAMVATRVAPQIYTFCSHSHFVRGVIYSNGSRLMRIIMRIIFTLENIRCWRNFETPRPASIHIYARSFTTER